MTQCVLLSAPFRYSQRWQRAQKKGLSFMAFFSVLSLNTTHFGWIKLDANVFMKCWRISLIIGHGLGWFHMIFLLFLVTSKDRGRCKKSVTVLNLPSNDLLKIRAKQEGFILYELFVKMCCSPIMIVIIIIIIIIIIIMFTFIRIMF